MAPAAVAAGAVASFVAAVRVSAPFAASAVDAAAPSVAVLQHYFAATSVDVPALVFVVASGVPDPVSDSIAAVVVDILDSRSHSRWDSPLACASAPHWDEYMSADLHSAAGWHCLAADWSRWAAGSGFLRDCFPVDLHSAADSAHWPDGLQYSRDFRRGSEEDCSCRRPAPPPRLRR